MRPNSNPPSAVPLRPAFFGMACRIGVIFAVLAIGVGCRQDMHNQPKYNPLRPSAFFTDGSSARSLPEGTVARGHLNDDVLYYRGVGPDGKASPNFPSAVTLATIARGEERFNVFCAPCHDRLGTGRGMVVRRGFKQPPSLQIDRLRQAPAGYFFDVITNGFATMPDMAAQVPPDDRWAIVAYIRALQLSQNAAIGDVPDDLRAQLTQGGAK